MDKEVIKNLAGLSRLHLSEEEAEKLSGEISAILSYVEEVKEISGSRVKNSGLPLKNVMREDAEGRPGGTYSEKILNAAPLRDGNYIKVKKIL